MTFPKKGKNKVTNAQYWNEDKGNKIVPLDPRTGKFKPPGISSTKLNSTTSLQNLFQDPRSSITNAITHTASQSTKGKEHCSQLQTPTSKPSQLNIGDFNKKPREHIVLVNERRKINEKNDSNLHGQCVSKTNPNTNNQDPITNFFD